MHNIPAENVRVASVENERMINTNVGTSSYECMLSCKRPSKLPSPKSKGQAKLPPLKSQGQANYLLPKSTG